MYFLKFIKILIKEKPFRTEMIKVLHQELKHERRWVDLEDGYNRSGDTKIS